MTATARKVVPSFSRKHLCNALQRIAEAEYVTGRMLTVCNTARALIERELACVQFAGKCRYLEITPKGEAFLKRHTNTDGDKQ